MSDSLLIENNQSVKVNRVYQNAVILSNIVELACSCLKKVATSDVGEALGDNSLNREVLANIVANRIKEKLIC